MNLRSTRTGVQNARRCCKALAVTSFALLATGCAEEPVEEPAPVRPVRMLTISGAVTGGSLEYPGEVQPVQRSEMSFQVPGRIIEFRVVEGQEVAADELLAQLDPADYIASRDAARARAQQSLAEYERFKQLYANDAVSLQDLEVRRRRHEVDQAALRTEQKALADTNLRAPFAGKVARKLVDDFQNVQAKEPVLVLQDTSTLEVDVNIPERDWGRATSGLTLVEINARINPRVIISAIPGRDFPAEITETARAADPVTRTFGVTLQFDPPEDANVLPGMTARVTVKPAEGIVEVLGIALPARAVLADSEDRPFVWKVDPDEMTVARQLVTVGELSGADIEVLDGLGDGDIVAVSGVHNLRDGMQVSRLAD